ncbi:MAG: Dps family protein [Flavobacteriales bacterium]
MSTNAIGIDLNKAVELSTKLNELLANYSIFYQNTRGFHWNIKGEKFFELHVKFEELYNDLLLKIDEIAERILTLGHTPEHSYSVYYKVSEVKETGKVADGKVAVANILDSFKTVILLQREILDLSDEANDEGTNSLMSDYISLQEKEVWMYSSFMKN